MWSGARAILSGGRRRSDRRGSEGQENLLEQKQRLEKLAAESGTDIAETTQQLEQHEAQLAQQKQRRADLTEKIAEQQTTIAGLQSKTGVPDPENVRAMRRAMSDAQIRMQRAHLN